MVEDFWGIFNNIRPPSRLNAGSNYHLFKTGIKPEWEHDDNKNGGKWNYWCVLDERARHFSLPPLRCCAAVHGCAVLTVASAGGWLCSIPKKDGKKVIDDIWLYTILAMIGENFDAGHELCGAVIRCACARSAADSSASVFRFLPPLDFLIIGARPCSLTRLRLLATSASARQETG
jgi:hypothetical protein